MHREFDAEWWPSLQRSHLKCEEAPRFLSFKADYKPGHGGWPGEREARPRLHAETRRRDRPSGRRPAWRPDTRPRSGGACRRSRPTRAAPAGSRGGRAPHPVRSAATPRPGSPGRSRPHRECCSRHWRDRSRADQAPFYAAGGARLRASRLITRPSALDSKLLFCKSLGENETLLQRNEKREVALRCLRPSIIISST